MGDVAIRPTAIPGLLVIDLVLHGDARGWFKENWQRAKMVELGLPDFGPVQNNMSSNTDIGVTRGLHAEPWDKLISIAHGRVFAAWVDLRARESFGTVVTLELGPETAVFVPRGVANGYQTLVPDTVYSYLVNAHWSPDARGSYSYLNLADETVAIAWPIPLAEAVISEADAAHPRLADATPANDPPAPRQGREEPNPTIVEEGSRLANERPRVAEAGSRIVIVGCGGQLGQALSALLPDAIGVDLPEFDLTRPEIAEAVDWARVATIINASAYTAVDAAETPEGRKAAWAANVDGVARLCRIAAEHRATLVHISSDYVFDGTIAEHDEDERFAPLGVYGQTKAAGDVLVGQLARHYIVRTSWVIGAGRNFVRTMAELAAKGISPTVVADQYGRLTFTDDLAAGIVHLLATGAPYGTYNLTNTGPVQSWADIAADVFELCGRSRAEVTPITTSEYAEGKLVSPRPVHSALRLDKLTATGFRPVPAVERLTSYVADLR